jgi:hypothetical protein
MVLKKKPIEAGMAILRSSFGTGAVVRLCPWVIVLTNASISLYLFGVQVNLADRYKNELV